MKAFSQRFEILPAGVPPAVGLLLNMYVAVWLLNWVFKFDIFTPLLLQGAAIMSASTAFMYLATMPTAKPYPWAKVYRMWIDDANQLGQDSSRIMTCLIAAGLFTAFVLAYNKAQWFWPSPIPICTSLFITTAIIRKRYLEFRNNSDRGAISPLQMAELACVGTAFVLLCGIHLHVLNKNADTLITLIGFWYLTSSKPAQKSVRGQ
ncbi:hypothetical protein RYA05_00380 [Pseudomonas syringae pv. actinidiae]|nr:hypothetical protein [Pseudomonas syringae pv. actinidiae]